MQDARTGDCVQTASNHRIGTGGGLLPLSYIPDRRHARRTHRRLRANGIESSNWDRRRPASPLLYTGSQTCKTHAPAIACNTTPLLIYPGSTPVGTAVDMNAAQINCLTIQ